MKLTLSLQLELEAEQLSTDLATLLAGLVAFANQAPEPQPLPESPKRRRRPPNPVPIVVGPEAWLEFDQLVRSEMARLADDGRMPEHRRWNNERDVRLPTMAQVMTGYQVSNILQLAHRLELRPPLSALGVAAYQQADEGTGREVADE